MTDSTLRRAQRDYDVSPCDETKLRLILARIRAGIQERPHLALAAATRTNLQCLARLSTHTAGPLDTSAALFLDFPVVEVIPLADGAQHVFERRHDDPLFRAFQEDHAQVEQLIFLSTDDPPVLVKSDVLSNPLILAPNIGVRFTYDATITP